MIEIFTMNPITRSKARRRKLTISRSGITKLLKKTVRKNTVKKSAPKRIKTLKLRSRFLKSLPKIKARKVVKKVAKKTARKRTALPVIRRKNTMKRTTYYNPPKRKVRRVKKNAWFGDKQGHKVATTLGWARDVAPRTAWKPLSEKYIKSKGKKGASMFDLLAHRRSHKFSKTAYKRPHKRGVRKGVARMPAPIFMSIAGKKTGIAANPGAASYRHITKYFAKKTGGRKGFKAAGKTWKKLTRSKRVPSLSRVRKMFPITKAKRRAANMPIANKYGYRYGYNKGRKTKRSYKRNYRYTAAPVLANYRYTAAPVLANYRYTAAPVLANSFARNPMTAVMEFPKAVLNVDFLKNTVAPITAGAIGSKIIAAQAAKMIFGKNPTNFSKFYAGAGWKKALWEAGAGIAAGTGLGLVTKGKYTDIGMKIAAGGLMAALLTLVETSGHFDAVRKLYEGKAGMGAMGASVEDDLKEKIAAELKTELEGISEFAQGNVGDYFDMEDNEDAVEDEFATLSSFVTTDALPAEQQGVTLDNFGMSPSL